MLKSKIHRAVVTQAEPDYIGSITIDADILKKAGILEYEKVQVADIETGSRFETYTIAGTPGSGVVCINGAAAKLANPGDRVIIMAYAEMPPEEAKNFKPTVIFVDEKNVPVRETRYEKAGTLFDVKSGG